MTSDQLTGEPAYRDGYFTVRDGLKLHYRDYPGSDARPPLLCLPALTRNARDFSAFAERYSGRFRVIVLDYRGRGLSDDDPVPGRYVPPTYAFDVVELLDQLGVPRAIFVGTSLGGLVTLAMTAVGPGRIAAVVLNDVGPELDAAGLERIKGYVGKDLRFRSWDEAARTIAANHGNLPASFTPTDWVEMAKRMCREENSEIRFDYDMAIAVPFKASQSAPPVDMWPFFRRLAQTPLLVVRGEKSDLLTAETAEKMQAAAPAVKFAVVQGVGHAPTLGEPEAIAAIDEFLEEISGG
jgi:pimeloyl-ACP methyl ester carboxylesterase